MKSSATRGAQPIGLLTESAITCVIELSVDSMVEIVEAKKSILQTQSAQYTKPGKFHTKNTAFNLQILPCFFEKLL